MAIRRQTHTYKVVADCEIQADIHFPAGAGQSRPTIVWIHGGCLIFGHRRAVEIARHAELYVSAGFLVVSIDYRLAPETKVAGIVADLQDAFRWVRRQAIDMYPIDPTRVAAVGHSAGGYLALMSGGHVNPPPKAIVSFYGYGDLAGPWANSPLASSPAISAQEAYRAVGDTVIANSMDMEGRGRYYAYLRQNGLFAKEITGYDPNTQPSSLASFCPVRHVDRDYPPTLLLHGDKDGDVPYEQSVLMARALANAGVENVLVTIPNGPHGFDYQWPDDPVVQESMRRVIEFLRGHLGSAEQATEDDG